MRNGNLENILGLVIGWVFLPYLWGMETNQRRAERVSSMRVLTVPMRNGNSGSMQKHVVFRTVLTVPMRNGNVLQNRKFRLSQTVLTVPMRNGNSIPLPPNRFFQLPFLPYLWGMETTWILWNWYKKQRSYRTYEEWKLVSAQLGLEPGALVLTVPMRNGNILKYQNMKRLLLRSYRTYEEWKQNNTREYYPRALCSYRTYEEWKP